MQCRDWKTLQKSEALELILKPLISLFGIFTKYVMGRSFFIMKNVTTKTILIAVFLANSLSAQMVGNLADGLVAYYPLHSDIKDYSSNGNDLVSSTGNSLFVSGALSIGNSEYLYSQNNIGISGNQNRTVSLWIKPTQTPTSSNDGYLASWGVGNSFWADSTLMYTSAFPESSGPAFAYVLSGSWVGIPAPFASNDWVNITYVYENNPNSIKFYLNGIHNSSLVGALEIFPNTTDTQFILNARTTSTGSAVPLVNTAGGNGIDGNYKDVYIYNRALSSSEVAALVPEPSALSLLSIGLGGLAMLRRRRS